MERNYKACFDCQYLGSGIMCGDCECTKLKKIVNSYNPACKNFKERNWAAELIADSYGDVNF